MEHGDYSNPNHSHALNAQYANTMQSGMHPHDMVSPVNVTSPTIAAPPSHYPYVYNEQVLAGGSANRGSDIHVPLPINYQYGITKAYGETGQASYNTMGENIAYQYPSNSRSHHVTNKYPKRRTAEDDVDSQIHDAVRKETAMLHHNGQANHVNTRAVSDDTDMSPPPPLIIDSKPLEITPRPPLDTQSINIVQDIKMHSPVQSAAMSLISSCLPPEMTSNTEVFPTSCVPQLRTTFESAKFWVQCAENASQRAAEFDTSIAPSLYKSVLEGINQFLLTIKDASQKCIDDATKYVPELSINPASLMPPIDQDSIDTSGKDLCDVKPDAESLAQSLERSTHVDTKLEDIDTNFPIEYDDAEAEDDVDDVDDDDQYFTRLRKPSKKRSKSRKLNKLKVKVKVPKSNNKTLKCSECNIVFTSRAEVINHVEMLHPDKHALTCKLCSKTYSTLKAIKKHLNEVHNKNKVCDICNKRFHYNYELENHKAKHATTAKKEFNPSAIFACSICGYSANRIHNLKSHIRFKHEERIGGVTDLGQFVVESVKGSEHESLAAASEPLTQITSLELSCMICNGIFSTKHGLHMHLKTHLGDDYKLDSDGAAGNIKSESPLHCKKCNKKCIDVKALYMHLKRVHGKTFKCKFCCKIFCARYQLEGHLRVHLNIRPYRCDVCTTKAFPSLTALRIHTRLKHPTRFPMKPYKCVRCDLAYTFKPQLTQHNNRTHNTCQPVFVKKQQVDSIIDTPHNQLTIKTEVTEDTTAEDEKSGEQCKKCGRTFSYNKLLENHIRRVHNKNFACHICSRRFGYPSDLKEHQMMHTNKNAFSCDYCNKKTHTRALIVQHAKFNHPHLLDNSKFACTVCDATFPLSVSLAHHAKTHERLPTPSGEVFSCDDCVKLFPTKLRLKIHMLGVHDDTSLIEPQDIIPGIVYKGGRYLPNRSNADPVMCTKCGLEFIGMDALSKHKVLKHNNDPKLQCPACDKICLNKEALRNHKRRVHGKKRSCPLCNKKFPFQYALEAHLLTHTGERNFTCQHCKKTFYTIQQLNVHVRLVHSGRSFSCDRCSAKFGTKQGRDRHIQHRHTNERPQTCEYCGRGFVDRRSLKAHIFIHTRQSDIVCDICNRMFGTRSCLNKHIRIQHKGERKLCPICGKHIAGALSSHLKSHGEKRYKCHQCEKIYAWPQGLKEHLRTHSGDKPYQCDICNKRFLGSANFSKHKKIHMKSSHEGSRRKPPAPQKIEREAVVDGAEPEVDYQDQYQAAMSQSVGQLMMNQYMMSHPLMNPAAMMNQPGLSQTMINQNMLSHHLQQQQQHGEHAQDNVVFPYPAHDKYH